MTVGFQKRSGRREPVGGEDDGVTCRAGDEFPEFCIDLAVERGRTRRAFVCSDAVAVVTEFNNPIYSLVVKPEIKSYDDLKGKLMGLAAETGSITNGRLAEMKIDSGPISDMPTFSWNP